MQIVRAGAFVALLLASNARAQQIRTYDFMLQGKVTMADGSAIPKPVVVERYCVSGRISWAALTDKQGNFRVPGNDVIEIGGSYRDAGDAGDTYCVLRASLSGYTSSDVEFMERRRGMDTRLPNIVLYRRGSESSALLSVGGRVPRAAGRPWDQAIRAIQMANWPAAEGLLRTAVRSAPDFDQAWNALGLVCQSQGKLDEARLAFRRAIQINPKSLPPYVSLARAALGMQDWSEAAQVAATLIAADNRSKYPEAYLYDAVAAYALNNLPRASSSIERLLKLDPNHRIPRAEYVQGLILEAKREYAAAASHMNTYLTLEPSAADAAAVKDRIAGLGHNEGAPLAGLVDANVLTSGEVNIPGGMRALAVLARFPADPSYRDFFAAYCRRLVRHTLPSAAGDDAQEEEVHAYLDVVRAYFAAVSDLSQMAPMRGDRGQLSIPLATKDDRARAQKVLALLGWRLVENNGHPLLELDDQPGALLRQRTGAALGVDEIAMQDALENGKSFTIELRADAARLFGGEAWNDFTANAAQWPGGVAELFARDLRLARVYAALSSMGPESASAVVSGVGLRALIERYSTLLLVNSAAFVLKDRAVAVPGGPAAAAVWENILHAKPTSPPAFFRALLEHEGGHALLFYRAISKCSPARQSYLLASTARAARLYHWHASAAGPALERALLQLPLDDAGRLRFAGGRAAWGAAVDNDEALLPTPAHYEHLARLAAIEDQRRKPLDAASASLILKFGSAWSGLTPYFGALPGLGRAEIESLSHFEGAVRLLDGNRRNQALGAWHSLTGLLILGVQTGALDEAASARAFREACETLGRPEARVLPILASLAGSGANLDDWVRAKLLRLDAVRMARFEEVLGLQNVPRLTAARNQEQDLAALAGLLYAWHLDPRALLVSLDSSLVRKHRYCGPCTPASPLFLPAELEVSGRAPGSHFSGGFGGFEKAAARLASAADLPAEALAAAPVRAAAPAGGKAAPVETTFQASSRLVEAHAVVTDGRGRYVDDLPASSFTLHDEGALQPILAFEPRSAGVSVALVLDSTASMHEAFPALKNAALKLIGELQAKDEVAVYSFNSTVKLLQPFTLDHVAARRAVVSAEITGDTALNDALVRVAADFTGRGGRKVIVLFTDGDDNRSVLTSEMSARRLKRAGIPVYSVAQGAAFRIPGLLKELAEISNATGGLPFRIQKPDEIRAVFERIAEDLQHGYLLTFRPQPTSAEPWRRITIQLRSGSQYKVRGREGYFVE